MRMVVRLKAVGEKRERLIEAEMKASGHWGKTVTLAGMNKKKGDG